MVALLNTGWSVPVLTSSAARCEERAICRGGVGYRLQDRTKGYKQLKGCSVEARKDAGKRLAEFSLRIM